MTDRFFPIPLHTLFQRILHQLQHGHYFGIPREVFYVPKDNLLQTGRFGQELATPVGPAAGPHTQLSQNIVGAWLCGARYMELKTIQTLDELAVSKPCIDMQDEGYNCEWSQELRIHQSFDQYLDAWIIIHLLAHHLGWKDADRQTIFNMSVGYNLEGILKPNVQWFFEKMNNCSAETEQKIEALATSYPWVKEVEIPSQISNNITLSTMHGCPPDEIEKIGMYLIKEKGLHTVIKLNPTLLGPERVRYILNDTLKYPTPIPDQAFAHDLKYPEAKRIIENLTRAAAQQNVSFGLKLTNTLESNNFRNILADDQKQMYMSGRALHPIAVNLAAKIRKDFPAIDISFSAGADCYNVTELLACNLSPVTVSTDLLKPGGYARLGQYLYNIHEQLSKTGYSTLKDWMHANPAGKLREYSQQVIEDTNYRKALREPNIKTIRPLDFFDCIHAPCMSTCPGSQDIPLYMYHVANGSWQKAFEVIMQTNPFPTITGTVCDHDCQSKCTRINYDSSLAIREVKKFVAAFENDEAFIKSLPANGQKAAIIGAGPAGLSCAWYLKLAGFEVDVYEEKPAAGGMVQQTIPDFRMTEAEIEKDIKRIASLGISIHYNTPVDKELFDSLHKSGSWIFVGIGARSSYKLNIPGEEAQGMKDPLDFLASFKQNREKKLTARDILIIGGGNTAMDVARTARRFAAPEARVRIIYRRTLKDMPASAEEIHDVVEEGIEIHELLAPARIITEKGTVKGLECTPMIVDGRDASGRQKVKPIKDKRVALEADMIIPAVGQHTRWDFADATTMKPREDGYTTMLERVFVGGDARAGASNIISAIADGRKVAQIIAQEAGNSVPDISPGKQGKADPRQLLIKKTHRMRSQITSAAGDKHLQPITTDAMAKQEAERCLLCDEICNICVSVCPNFANQGYEVDPFILQLQKAIQDKDGKVTIMEDAGFSISQKYQIYNIADWCNECGNCRTFCPTMGAPYKDKPKIHISRESWQHATEGFRFIKKGELRLIEQKTNSSQVNRLEETPGGLIFTTPDFSAKLDPATLKIENISFTHQQPMEVKLDDAAVMFTLLKETGQTLTFET
ncbi:MAG: putative selenate reductase subunit YgfK [Bacteroidota bacterium]